MEEAGAEEDADAGSRTARTVCTRFAVLRRAKMESKLSTIRTWCMVHLPSSPFRLVHRCRRSYRLQRCSYVLISQTGITRSLDRRLHNIPCESSNYACLRPTSLLRASPRRSRTQSTTDALSTPLDLHHVLSISRASFIPVSSPRHDVYSQVFPPLLVPFDELKGEPQHPRLDHLAGVGRGGDRDVSGAART